MQSPESFGSERPSGTPQPVQAAPQYGAPLPNPTGGYEAPRVAGRRVLKRIDPGSAFKIGAVISALTWAVLGLPFIFVMGAIMSAAASSIPGAANNSGMAFGGGVIGYIFGIALYGIMGGIGAVIWAFIYNLVAGWMGGIEFDLE